MGHTEKPKRTLPISPCALFSVLFFLSAFFILGYTLTGWESFALSGSHSGEMYIYFPSFSFTFLSSSVLLFFLWTVKIFIQRMLSDFLWKGRRRESGELFSDWGTFFSFFRNFFSVPLCRCPARVFYNCVCFTLHLRSSFFWIIFFSALEGKKGSASILHQFFLLNKGVTFFFLNATLSVNFGSLERTLSQNFALLWTFANLRLLKVFFKYFLCVDFFCTFLGHFSINLPLFN